MRRERRTDRFRVNPGPRLAGRLTRAVALGAGTALLLSGLIFDLFVYFSARSALINELSAQARVVADNSSAAILFRDAAVATQTLAGLQASKAIEAAQLYDADGREIAHYRAPGAPAPQALQRLAPSELPLPEGGHVFAHDRLFLVQAVHENQQFVGSVRLTASLAGLHRQVLSFVGITLGAGLLSYGIAFVIVGRIRRELNATERRLDYLAYYDPVTGLLNRHAANEQIDRLIAAMGPTSEGFALLLIDLDDFKVVNDTLGHAMGDELLRALAGRLTQFMQSTDLAFRFGGDEFVILAPRVGDEAQQHRLGAAALQAFEAPVLLGAHELRVRGSVGLAHFPSDANNAAGLIRAADTAMYEAKRSGKNTYARYDPEMDRGAARRLRLESDLRGAVARGELHLNYQPIVDLRTQRLAGVEALVRWTHPELGMISPVEFIPLAEYSGLIVDLGQWVMLTACRQMKAWNQAGHHQIFVAVNVSALQVRRNVKAQIDAVLAETGIDPRSLEIEITEHSMVEDIESNMAQLRALRDLGCQVAIDDFGTGLSSLAYLKRLPIGKLKIDRAFVKDLPGNTDDAAIASAVISMSHHLGLTVVAEGVETQAQREFLSRLGCDYAQGYLYSRPVAPEAIEELLGQQARDGHIAAAAQAAAP